MIRKVPKISTIRGRINFYAYKCGFLLVRQSNGLYNVFDVRMHYNVRTSINMDEVVNCVADTMNAIAYRNNSSLVIG